MLITKLTRASLPFFNEVWSLEPCKPGFRSQLYFYYLYVLSDHLTSPDLILSAVKTNKQTTSHLAVLV